MIYNNEFTWILFISLTCGTTWHAAGLVGMLKANTEQRELAKITADLYENLEAETGLSTGIRDNWKHYDIL